jgi:hypothetical protein
MCQNTEDQNGGYDPSVIEHYVRTFGGACPHCKSDNIGSVRNDIDNDRYYKLLICYHCGEQWFEEWQLVGIHQETPAPCTTSVVFRQFHGGVIALFPDEEFDLAGNISSYEHVGQHGAASPSLVDELPAATPEQYAALKEELESIGYDLVVCP